MPFRRHQGSEGLRGINITSRSKAAASYSQYRDSMKTQETVTCLIAVLVVLLIVSVVLKIIVEAIGLIIVLVVLWFVYTHMLLRGGK